MQQRNKNAYMYVLSHYFTFIYSENKLKERCQIGILTFVIVFLLNVAKFLCVMDELSIFKLFLLFGFQSTELQLRKDTTKITELNFKSKESKNK